MFHAGAGKLTGTPEWCLMLQINCRIKRFIHLSVLGAIFLLPSVGPRTTTKKKEIKQQQPRNTTREKALRKKPYGTTPKWFSFIRNSKRGPSLALSVCVSHLPSSAAVPKRALFIPLEEPLWVHVLQKDFRPT